MSKQHTNLPGEIVLWRNDSWLKNNGISGTGAFKTAANLSLPGAGAAVEASVDVIDVPGILRKISRVATLISGRFAVSDDSVRFWPSHLDGVSYAVTESEHRFSELAGVAVHLWAIFLEDAQAPATAKLDPVLVLEATKSRTETKTVNLSAILGLGDILFPDHKGACPIPRLDTVGPRLIVIRGKPGTGKTTLAVQLLLALARQNVQCEYLCSNDRAAAVKHTALSYGFCTEAEWKYFCAEGESNRTPCVTLTEIFDSHGDTLRKLAHRASPRRTLRARIAAQQDFATEALFVDSIDPHRLEPATTDNKPSALRKILYNLKQQPRLSFVFIEEGDFAADPIAKQNLNDCEQLADILLELQAVETAGYQTYVLRVVKRHFGPHVRGWHEYKLLSREHAISNIDPTRGFAAYPSLHYYISQSRVDNYTRTGGFVHTGIAHLDSILESDQMDLVLDGRTIPSNSCFVIQSTDSPYDDAIALNILLGGLWSPVRSKDRADTRAVRNRDVLMLSLSEETNIDLGREAIAYRTELCTDRTLSTYLDNGHWLRWRRHDGTMAKDSFAPMLARFPIGKSDGQLWNALRSRGIIDDIGRVCATGTPTVQKLRDAIGVGESDVDKKFVEALQTLLAATQHGEQHYQVKSGRPTCAHCALFTEHSNDRKKVVFNKWCTHLLGPDGTLSRDCAKVVLAVFRPGCITPEEFLRILHRLLKDGAFSRILFSSTALLAGRFPLLANSDLFVPALIDLFKAQNVISIFLDPQHGVETPSPLSRSLRSLADYLIQLDPSGGAPFTREYPADAAAGRGSLRDVIENDRNQSPWSDMVVHNLRRKNYTRAIHSVTVTPIVGSPVSPTKYRSVYEWAHQKCGKAELLLSVLAERGLLTNAKEDGATTDLTYTSAEVFDKLLGQRLRELAVDPKAVWECLTMCRPSRGNELHIVNDARSRSIQQARSNPPKSGPRASATEEPCAPCNACIETVVPPA